MLTSIRPYFRYRPSSVALHISLFVTFSVVYLLFVATFVPTVETITGRISAIAAFLIVPWFPWYLLSGISGILVPRPMRARVALSGREFRVTSHRGRFACQFSGIGISGLGMCVGAAMDPSFSPGGLYGVWRYWVPIFGVLGVLAYGFVCGATSETVIREGSAETVTRAWGFLRAVQVDNLECLRLDGNGVAHVIAAEGGTLPLSLSTFNSPQVLSIEAVCDVTGIEIRLQ